MTIIQPGIFVIMHRFPHCRDVVRYKFLDSESFQSICKDYQICSEALEYWAKSEHENAPDRHQEYLTLLHEIESDIFQSLDKVSSNTLTSREK